MPKDSIPELQGDDGKMRYLFDGELPRRVARSACKAEVTSFPTLARALDLRSHTNLVEDVLSGPTLEKIRELYRIPPKSPCWRAFLTGTCALFKAEFDKVHKGFVPPPEAPERLVEDLHFDDPDRRANNLAMLTLFAPQNSPERQLGSIYVSFTLNCPAIADMDFVCGIRSGILKFSLGSAYTGHVKDRQAYATPIQCNNAVITVHDNDTHNPGWRIQSANDSYIGNVTDVPVDFLHVHGLSSGATITGSLRIYVSEVGVSFSMDAGIDQNVARSKLKQRLKQKKLLADDGGVVDVAVARIKLIKGDQT